MRLTNPIKQPRWPTVKWALGEVKIYLTAGLLSVAVMLATAGFSTVYQGLLNFANSKAIALAVAIGLESILFVTAWIFARESAIHADRRQHRSTVWHEDEPRTSARFFRTVSDQLVGVFEFGVAQPSMVATLLATMATSAFFSFDALSKVFNDNNSLSFERAQSLLQNGDSRTWAALFVALSLDVFILIMAVLGERTSLTPSVQHGFVASKSEIDGMTAENYVDIAIYPGDSVQIRNYKIFIAHVATEVARNHDVEGLHSVVDLSRVDRSYSDIMRTMIDSAAASYPPRAHEIAGRPNVFRIENALLRHYTHEIGIYEKQRAELRGPRDPASGEAVRPLEKPIEASNLASGSRYGAL